MQFWRSLCLIALSSGTLFAQKAEMIGRWEAIEDKERIIFTLDQDGSGSFDGITFTYKIEGNELEATFFYGIFHYVYELGLDKTKTNQLTLKEGNLEHPYVFTKKEASSNGMRPIISVKELDLSLIGTWTDENNQITFNEDGTVLVNGVKHTYKTQGGAIKLYKGNQMEQAPYSVFQTTLAMALDGEVLQLKKKK